MSDKRKIKDRPYVANYPPLKDWLDHHEMRCNWQIPLGQGNSVGQEDEPRAYVESWAARGRREVIVIVRENLHGWDIFTSANVGVRVDATLADAEARLGLAGNRKLTLGEQIDRAIDRAELDSLQQLRIKREAGFLRSEEENEP